MLSLDIRTFRENAMDESLPLAKIHDAILDFLRGRNDAVVFGAHAVNAYVDEARLTQDVDVLTTNAQALAEELRAHLAGKFNAAIRVCELAPAIAYRIYQLARPNNRHLADIRGTSDLPPTQRVEGVLVPVPAELVAQKVISLAARRGRPKAGSDWRDIASLLLIHPELKVNDGEVETRLRSNNATEDAMREWRSTVASNIQPDSEEY